MMDTSEAALCSAATKAIPEKVSPAKAETGPVH